ncbi:hypothetical protein MD484_g1488, partial [Candolleomyces efflorescens]
MVKISLAIGRTGAQVTSQTLGMSPSARFVPVQQANGPRVGAQIAARAKQTGQYPLPGPPPPPALPSRAVPTVPPPVIKTEPDIDADLALQALLKPSSDDELDADPDIIDLSYPDVELSYPTSGLRPTPVPPLPTRVPKPVPVIKPEPKSPTIPYLPTPIPPLPSRKRRKVSHNSINVAVAPPPIRPPPPVYLPPTPISPVPPLPSRPKPPQPLTPTPTRTSKTCSGSGCTNPVGASSSASRCMACISKDWKVKRAGAATAVAATAAKRNQSKAVSWADRGEEHDEFNFTKILEKVDQIDASADSTPSGRTTPGSISGWDSELSDLTNSEEGDTSSSSEAEAEPDSESEASSSESTEEAPPPVRTGLKIRIRIPAKVVAEPTNVQEPPEPLPPSVIPPLPRRSSLVPVPSEPLPPSVIPPLPRRSSLIPLSLRTSASASSSSQSQPLSPATPIPGSSKSSSFTPPVQANLPVQSGLPTQSPDGARICASSACRSVLPPDYHWKSCVVCRAAARGYQRKRLNIQGKHSRLDLELEQHLAENPPLEGEGGLTSKSSSPSAPHLPSATRKATGEGRPRKKRPKIKVDIEPFDDDDPSHNLVPGARQCSSKECTYMIPSPDEYSWKMCSKCRRRGKNGNLRRSGVYVPKDAPPKEFKHEISGPEAIAMKQADGRCLSFDCGMLVSRESKYPYCRQCRLRDWKHKRRFLRAQAKDELDGGEDSDKDGAEKDAEMEPPSKRLSIKIPALRTRLTKPIKPRPPTPYPEYKNLAALLANFRLLAKNFFDAQTMHFAHHKPTPNTLSIFIFDGEFTAVAPDYVINRKEANQMVMSIMREVQDTAKLQVAPQGFVTRVNHGAVTRFTCQRDPQTVSFIMPDKGGGKKVVKAKSYHKVMDGEVEVAVFADHNHPFIPGERTVVRVRLVG